MGRSKSKTPTLRHRLEAAEHVRDWQNTCGKIPDRAAPVVDAASALADAA